MSLKSERGASLVEVMVGLAVGVGLVTGLVMVVYAAGRQLDQTNGQLTVFRGIESATAFLAADVSSALYVDLAEGASNAASITLQWTDYYGGVASGYSSSYAISGGNLVRSYTAGGITVATTVARSVSSVGFSRGATGLGTARIITASFTVTTTEGPTSFSDTKPFRFVMRPQPPA